MGMTIDNTCESKPMSKEEIVDTLKTMVFGVKAFERFNAKERETLDKAWNIIDQYENRLKADMVDMLEDLRLDFQEAELAGVLDNRELIFADEVDDLVQQKINELKAESEDT